MEKVHDPQCEQQAATSRVDCGCADRQRIEEWVEEVQAVESADDNDEWPAHLER